MWEASGRGLIQCSGNWRVCLRKIFHYNKIWQATPRKVACTPSVFLIFFFNPKLSKKHGIIFMKHRMTSRLPCFEIRLIKFNWDSWHEPSFRFSPQRAFSGSLLKISISYSWTKNSVIVNYPIWNVLTSFRSSTNCWHSFINFFE